MPQRAPASTRARRREARGGEGACLRRGPLPPMERLVAARTPADPTRVVRFKHPDTGEVRARARACGASSAAGVRVLLLERPLT